jgi:hypothetical protein
MRPKPWGAAETCGTTFPRRRPCAAHLRKRKRSCNPEPLSKNGRTIPCLGPRGLSNGISRSFHLERQRTGGAPCREYEWCRSKARCYEPRDDGGITCLHKIFEVSVRLPLMIPKVDNYGHKQCGADVKESTDVPKLSISPFDAA